MAKLVGRDFDLAQAFIRPPGEDAPFANLSDADYSFKGKSHRNGPRQIFATSGPSGSGGASTSAGSSTGTSIPSPSPSTVSTSTARSVADLTSEINHLDKKVESLEKKRNKSFTRCGSTAFVAMFPAAKLLMEGAETLGGVGIGLAAGIVIVAAVGRMAYSAYTCWRKSKPIKASIKKLEEQLP